MSKLRRWLAWAAALGTLLVATRALVAPTLPSLDGTWSGTVDVKAARAHGTASGSLGQSGRSVTGTLVLDATDVTGTFGVSGSLRGKRARLFGVSGGQRLRWRAHWSRKAKVWRGRLVCVSGGHDTYGVLALGRDDGPTPQCGADYFTSDVMPTVMEPLCSHCHVPGGQAQAAPFRVTAGDATATSRSALREVDPVDPAHSRLIEKPRADVSHGGGKQIVPGSPEEQVLLHWIGLVTAPGCGAGPGGGGTGADIYAFNCASCHGTDGRGLQGNPDIHCARSIADAVRNGRKGGAVDMPAFPTLADADIDKVQTFLVGLCPVTTATGADLFASNCASCHGADATGTPGKPSVRCATRVVDAIRNGRGTAMPTMTALTDPEVTLIEGHLTNLCTQAGRPGADVWAGNCAGCHGDTGRGGRNGLGVAGPDVHCSRDLATPVRNGKGTDMPPFPGLADADVTALQDYVTTDFCPTGTATGADIYASNCASCHGAGAAGTTTAPDVRCATRVPDALALGRGAKMPAFSGIAGTDLANLQSYLGQLCTQGGRTGTELYAANCVSCHGDTAHGATNGLGVIGPDIHCNLNLAVPVQAGQGTAMPAFPALATADVAALQQYVTTGFCPAGTATGADLYASNCASCHGAGAAGTTTAPDVRCATRVPDALAVGRGTKMPAFPGLSGANLTNLESYLGQLCTQGGRTGTELYAGNCVTCHGDTAHGATNGLGVAGPDIHCSRSIATPVLAGQGTAMPAFPGLATADVTALQQYITTGFCPAGTATGADLYASNCATCHGTDARGVGGNPNVRCNRGIHDVVLLGRTGLAGTMPAFTMTDAEVGLVQGYLVGLCPAGTASGVDLYAGNCETCHGLDAGGSSTAPSVRCATLVSDALARGRGTRMPSFPAFPAADLTTVVGYLDQLCAQYGRTGSDLYAGNCSSCHGANAGGGRNGLGVRGENIQCTGLSDYQEKVRNGDDAMPRFPALGTGDVTVIYDFVRGAYCR